MNLLRRQWLRFREWISAPRELVRIEGDVIPAAMPSRDLVLLSEGGDAWSVRMACPCGCGQLVELPLIPEASPCWRLEVDDAQRPTLMPSVWLRTGCKSHFFVRAGKVHWVGVSV